MRRVLGVSAATAAVLAGAAVAVAQITGGVPNAQPRMFGVSSANKLAAGWSQGLVAQGDNRLENPQGIFKWYGYLDDAALQSDGQRTKTEPDKNTFLTTTDNPGGPSAGYDYGRHFLIQGHEVFGTSHAYLTRVNLDVLDPNHRITLLSYPDSGNATDPNSTGLTSVDGSTFDPFTGQLLFTMEAGSGGGVVAQPFTWTSTTPPARTRLDSSIGRGGYEGIQNDRLGNLIIAEDVGGSNITDNGTATKVRQPNSFLYRFKPARADDLTKGKLQALQVSVDGTPITFHTGAGARDDALGAPIKRLHSGETLQAQWVTIHNTNDPNNWGTSVAGTPCAAADANCAAKGAGATPLKRPENGLFVPGTDFKSYVFDETGDTNKDGGEYVSATDGAAAADRGAWGALLRLDLSSPGADTGTIKTIVNGDAAHASFDNLAFLDDKTLLAAEDRGDTLHQQLNALDSLWSFDLAEPLSAIDGDAQRLVAEGRDPQATADVALRENPDGTPLSPVQTHNDGDNEVTGIHVSDGSPFQNGLLGAKTPGEGPGWRIFWTQQHGANMTWETTPPGEAPGPSASNQQKVATDDAQAPAAVPGVAGTQGPAGASGATGPEGATGPRGPAGNVRISTGRLTTRGVTLRLSAPEAGELSGSLSAKGAAHAARATMKLGSFRKVVSGKRTVQVTVRTTAAQRAVLKRNGVTKGRLALTFTTADGQAATVTSSAVAIRG